MNKLGAIVLSFLLLFSIFPQVTIAAQGANFEQELTQYLEEVSIERGFEVTKQDIEVSLALYEESIENFESVEELSDFLGEVIKFDLSNLESVYDEYELDEDMLGKLLNKNGEEINDYIFVDDLSTSAIFYGEEDSIGVFPGMDEEIADSILPVFYQEIDLTDEELERIGNHLISLDEHFSDPVVLERLEELSARMLVFEDFDTITDLTAEQIAEIASIYEEILSVFKLKVEFSLVNGNSETTLSLKDMIKLEELKGTKLKVALYSEDGQLLADFIVTGDMVESDTIIDTGAQIKESTKEVTKTLEQNSVKTKKQKTANGAKLPTTATDYIPNSLLGLFISLAGILMYRKVKHV